MTLRWPSPFRILLWLYLLGVFAFLLLPLLVVVPVSFTAGTIIKFPPDGFSLRWYEDYFDGRFWLDATWLSFRVGLATAVFATALGAVTALALTRYLKFGASLIRLLVLSPLIVPVVITSVAVFDIYNQTGLRNTFWGLVLGHTILALPYTVIIIESALKNFDVNLEDAAVSLGASRLTAMRKITLPLIAPSLFGGAVFAFVVSWDDVVLALWIGGGDNITLPRRMFEFMATQVRPTTAAISTLLFGGLLAVVITMQLIGLVRSRLAR